VVLLLAVWHHRCGGQLHRYAVTISESKLGNQQKKTLDGKVQTGPPLWFKKKARLEPGLAAWEHALLATSQRECSKLGNQVRTGVCFFFLVYMLNWIASPTPTVVKAYQYTSLTSVMLLDCWSIPCVIVLTWIFLKTKYGLRKFIGVGVCVAGLVLVVFSDAHASDRASKNMLHYC